MTVTRGKLTAEELLAAAGLTDDAPYEDKILEALAESGMLTSDQIATLTGVSPNTARARMLSMVACGQLIRGRKPGSARFHYLRSDGKGVV